MLKPGMPRRSGRSPAEEGAGAGDSSNGDCLRALRRFWFFVIEKKKDEKDRQRIAGDLRQQFIRTAAKRAAAIYVIGSLQGLKAGEIVASSGVFKHAKRDAGRHQQRALRQRRSFRRRRHKRE